jgi:DHA2 family multidrug resistance protein
VPLLTISLPGIAPDKLPAASGLFNFCRITAGSFGTSIVTTLWDRRATLHHARLVERLSSADPATGQALAGLPGGAASDQNLSLLNRLVDQQAFMLSANDIFYFSALLFLLLIGVIWLARRSGGAAPSAAASAAH